MYSPLNTQKVHLALHTAGLLNELAIWRIEGRIMDMKLMFIIIWLIMMKKIS